MTDPALPSEAELDKRFEKLDAVLEDVLDNFMKTGSSIAELMDIDRNELEGLYALGHQKYMEKQYTEAVQVLATLCRIDHHNARNFRSLGMALQMGKKYNEAIDCYGMALAIDLTDAVASLHAGECLMLLGKKEEAKSALEGCVIQAKDDHDKYKDALAKSSSLLEHIAKS